MTPIMMLWMIVTALVTIAVLTIGTLGAADMLPKRAHSRARRERDRRG